MFARSRGFTLTEILIGVAIIGITLTIAVPAYLTYLSSTRTVDAINALKAIELEILVPARMERGLQICDDSLVLPDNLVSDYLDLGIAAIPNDMTKANSDSGFGAALDVVARNDQHGWAGVQVARAFREEIRQTRPGALVDGVDTASAVAFSVRLSPPDQPYCADPLGLATAATAPPDPATNRAPRAGQNVSLGTADEDTELAINVKPLLDSSWDPDGNPLSIVSVSASKGSILGDAGSGFRYMPPKDFHGAGVTLQFEVSDGLASSNGTATLDVDSVVDEPRVSLSISVAQDVLQTGTSGRAVIPKLDTGGDLREVALEFSIVGRAAGSATASTGPVILNYGTASSNNLISAWRPNNLTIAFLGKDYASGIDLTDGTSHRVTISWSSAAGELQLYDNGKLLKTFSNVAKGQSLPGDGHMVLGQKMNNPGTQNGWNANEHYGGQFFSAAMANQARSAADVARAPLYTTSAADGLLMDVRAQGGAMQDAQGHPVQMQGDFAVQSTDVDSHLALVPPAARVTIRIDAQPGDSDSKIKSIQLNGLPAGVTITDGTHTGSGATDISDWNLAGITAQLPASLKSNLSVSVVAIAEDADGGTATGSATQVLSMVP